MKADKELKQLQITVTPFIKSHFWTTVVLDLFRPMIHAKFDYVINLKKGAQLLKKRLLIKDFFTR